MNTTTLPTNEELVQFALEAMPRFCWTTTLEGYGSSYMTTLHCPVLGLTIGYTEDYPPKIKRFSLKSKEADGTPILLVMTPEEADKFHEVFTRACLTAEARARTNALECLATIIATTKEP